MKRIFYLLTVLSMLTVSTISFAPLKDAPRNEDCAVVITGINKAKPYFAKWTVDKMQSTIKFSVTHLMVSKATGVFKIFEGTMESSKPDFSDARISFTIDAASIDTDNDARDKHLRSDDYFDVAKYPKIRFESTSFKPARGKRYKLSGNLTMKDVTKAVVFDVLYGGTTGVDKNAKASFNCTTAINRYDYNISSGGAALGKDVNIMVDVVLTASK